MSAPPSGHSGTWVEVCYLNAQSLICLLGLDLHRNRLRVSPAVHWFTALSSPLSVISPGLLSSLGLPFSGFLCNCGQVVGRQKASKKTNEVWSHFMEPLFYWMVLRKSFGFCRLPLLLLLLPSTPATTGLPWGRGDVQENETKGERELKNFPYSCWALALPYFPQHSLRKNWRISPKSFLCYHSAHFRFLMNCQKDMEGKTLASLVLVWWYFISGVLSCLPAANDFSESSNSWAVYCRRSETRYYHSC